VQRRAARHEDPQIAVRAEQLGHELAGGQDMLEVVQDQQDLAVRQVAGHVLEQ